jgi:hypothetical protein
MGRLRDSMLAGLVMIRDNPIRTLGRLRGLSSRHSFYTTRQLDGPIVCGSMYRHQRIFFLPALKNVCKMAAQSLMPLPPTFRSRLIQFMNLTGFVSPPSALFVQWVGEASCFRPDQSGWGEDKLFA